MLVKLKLGLTALVMLALVGSVASININDDGDKNAVVITILGGGRNGIEVQYWFNTKPYGPFQARRRWSRTIDVERGDIIEVHAKQIDHARLTCFIQQIDHVKPDVDKSIDQAGRLICRHMVA